MLLLSQFQGTAGVNWLDRCEQWRLFLLLVVYGWHDELVGNATVAIFRVVVLFILLDVLEHYRVLAWTAPIVDVLLAPHLAAKMALLQALLQVC